MKDGNIAARSQNRNLVVKGASKKELLATVVIKHMILPQFVFVF